jgi:hypothetical protein
MGGGRGDKHMELTEVQEQVHEREEARKHRHRVNIWIRVMTLWIILFSAISIYDIHQNRIQAKKGEVALASNCKSREDLKNRIKLGEKFLKENPKGIPGIPAGTVRASLRNQRLAYRAQRILNPYCKDGKVVTP